MSHNEQEHEVTKTSIQEIRQRAREYQENCQFPVKWRKVRSDSTRIQHNLKQRLSSQES